MAADQPHRPTDPRRDEDKGHDRAAVDSTGKPVDDPHRATQLDEDM
jgi:hypothetical protein